MASNLVTVFNNHFEEFVTDIQNVFPEDPDILLAKNALLAIRRANPKLLPKIWVEYIANIYENQIESGDISFFINKDYSKDVSHNSNSVKIMEAIDRLRLPVKQMSHENQSKTMKYIQNLTKLSRMFPQ
jgi:hypothetical protein